MDIICGYNMIKAIIFDFAGVVASPGAAIWFKKSIPDYDLKKSLVDQLSDKLDKGDLAQGDFCQELSKINGLPPEAVWPGIHENTIPNYPLLELMQKLKGKYKIGLLSNYEGRWLNELLDEYKLRQYFDEILISSECKMIKPEPGIYLKMLKMLDTKPGEAVFVDDRSVNVEAANKIGIHGILYSDLPQVKKELLNNEVSL